MTPKMVYVLPPCRDPHDTHDLLYYVVKQLTSNSGYALAIDITMATRVTVRLHAVHEFDYRRTWQLFSLCLDKDPVMLVQIAGREGDDYYHQFITNVSQYHVMVAYLRSLSAEVLGDDEITSVLDAEMACEDLTSFYGWVLPE